MSLSVRIRRLAAAGLVLLGIIVFRRPLIQTAGLMLGGAALAFLLTPVSDFFERRLSRPASALAAVLSLCLMLALILYLALPAVARQTVSLFDALPRSLSRVAAWADGLSAWAGSRLPGVRLPGFPVDAATGALSEIAARAMAALGSLASGVSRLSLMLVLAFFFLCDRERLLLRLELLTPRALRPAAVRAARAVSRELWLYLQGQFMIAGAVGALSAAGLALIGVRSALVLGGIVGLLNMVPYFGPFIGGVPALLIALGDGVPRALMCVGVLALVQQADSAILSPRIMGGLTGFSPAAVLIAIYAGGSFAGIGGMLIALPLGMSIRTVFRVFVQSYENI